MTRAHALDTAPAGRIWEYPALAFPSGNGLHITNKGVETHIYRSGSWDESLGLPVATEQEFLDEGYVEVTRPPAPATIPAGEPEATPGRITEAMVQRAAEVFDPAPFRSGHQASREAADRVRASARAALEAALALPVSPVSLTAGELRAEHIGREIEWGTTRIRLDGAPVRDLDSICLYGTTRNTADWHFLYDDTLVTLLPEGGER